MHSNLIFAMSEDAANSIGSFFAQWGIIIIMFLALIAMFFFTSRSNKKRQKRDRG